MCVSCSQLLFIFYGAILVFDHCLSLFVSFMVTMDTVQISGFHTEKSWTFIRSLGSAKHLREKAQGSLNFLKRRETQPSTV